MPVQSQKRIRFRLGTELYNIMHFKLWVILFYVETWLLILLSRDVPGFSGIPWIWKIGSIQPFMVKVFDLVRKHYKFISPA